MLDPPDQPAKASDCGARPAMGLSFWQWAVLLVAILGPRAVRMAAPRVWLEDTPYLYAAHLLAQGHRPYVDFVCPHFPVLEFTLAGAYKAFGTTHRTAEALTQLATLLSCLMVFALTRQSWRRLHAGASASHIDGYWPGLIASVLYGACSLTFRFHLFEREVFLCLVLLGTAYAALRGRDLSLPWAVSLGVALGLGLTIKLTFALYAAVLIGFVILELRQRCAAAAMACVCLGVCATATALGWWAYGSEFLFQVYAFHFFKGHNFVNISAKLQEARLWCSLPMVGVLLCVPFADQVRDRLTRLAWATFAAYAVYFAVLSPTLWAHNMLMLLPSMAVLGGLGAGRWVESVQHAFRSRRCAARAALGLAVLLAGPTLLFPVRNKNWRAEGAWGFAGMRRSDIAAAARFIRERVGPHEPICAPPIVALEAQRLDPFHYRELLGVYRWARASVNRLGWRDTRLISRHAFFYILEEECRRYWLPDLLESVRTRTFAAAVPDTHSSHYAVLLPRVMTPFLRSSGYTPALDAGPLCVWLRPDKTADYADGSGAAAYGRMSGE